MGSPRDEHKQGEPEDGRQINLTLDIKPEEPEKPEE
mgnify:CR=1 FL=1